VWDYYEFHDPAKGEVFITWSDVDAADQFVEKLAQHFDDDRFLLVVHDEANGLYTIVDFVKEWHCKGTSKSMTLEEVTEGLNKWADMMWHARSLSLLT